MEVQIRVRGFRELARDMRAIDRGALQGELRGANLAFARRIVPIVQERYTRHYTVRDGYGIGSIRATAGVDRATIVIGGARAPYMPGQEFGSNRYPQFRPWTGPAPSGVGSRGRFLYPVIRDELPDLADEYAEAIDPVLARAFPDRGIGLVL